MVNQADNELDDDEGLPPLADLVSGFAAYFEPQANEAMGMIVSDVTVDLPVELDVDVLGVMRGSTPTQYTETTVMPVFHRLRLRIEASDDDG